MTLVQNSPSNYYLNIHAISYLSDLISSLLPAMAKLGRAIFLDEPEEDAEGRPRCDISAI